MLTRRQFGKTAGYGALGVGIGMTTMGLSCDTVFQDIQNYVPIGIAAFNEILTLISPTEATSLAPIVATVKASFADLSVAINQYIQAPSTDKASLEGKIVTAINAVINNLNQFWADANLPNSQAAQTIVGVLQIVLSTLAAFLPKVGGAVSLKKTFAKQIPILPRDMKALKSKQVKADINVMFSSHGYQNRVY